ncbi:hypothetical protein OPV22_017775 [Ensete ventricosum]|uniref:Uncharacterized protein n=1 Tax=Ensete ventricosum TaxID=4639 RepID=A0AAV8PFK9_ENSVE|nr:hypothetical protein OPV22_017775 [Ensete ventricosum]
MFILHRQQLKVEVDFTLDKLSASLSLWDLNYHGGLSLILQLIQFYLAPLVTMYSNNKSVEEIFRTTCKLIHWSLPLGTDSSLMGLLPPSPAAAARETNQNLHGRFLHLCYELMQCRRAIEIFPRSSLSSRVQRIWSIRKGHPWSPSRTTWFRSRNTKPLRGRREGRVHRWMKPCPAEPGRRRGVR